MNFEILTDAAIVAVRPSSPLTEGDFIELTTSVDAYLESHDRLQGLLIQAEKFPGWEDLEGFVGHMKFVKDHHQKIEKVALVSDSQLAWIAPKLTSHLISAEVRGFSYDSFEAALEWLQTRES